MRMLIKEADLRELSGLTEDRLDPEEYRKMRQYLKIDRLIFGTFSINADEINIQTKIIDHDTGDKLASFSQTGAEQSETHQLCVNYMNEFNNYMKSKQFTTEDYYKEYAAYYLNNFKMAATLPQWHGDRTARPWFVSDVFFILQHQIEADDKDPGLRAAFIMPALFNDRVDEAALEYEKLEQENPFLADVVIRAASWVSIDENNRFENDPQKSANAQAFLKAVGRDSVVSRQYQ